MRSAIGLNHKIFAMHSAYLSPLEAADVEEGIHGCRIHTWHSRSILEGEFVGDLLTKLLGNRNGGGERATAEEEHTVADAESLDVGSSSRDDTCRLKTEAFLWYLDNTIGAQNILQICQSSGSPKGGSDVSYSKVQACCVRLHLDEITSELRSLSAHPRQRGQDTRLVRFQNNTARLVR